MSGDIKKTCLVCVLSRSNWGRLRSICEEIEKNPQLELHVLQGCSSLHLNIPYKTTQIQCLMHDDNKESMALTTATLLMQLPSHFRRINPDMVIVHGDRYETLACAITASYLGILLAHTEGGEHSGCVDDKIRYAISSLADIHFAVTETASEMLARFTIGQIHTVGSTGLDNIEVIDGLNNYVLVLHHPNTSNKEDIIPLTEVIKNYENVIWVEPNTDAGCKEIARKAHSLDNVNFVKHLTPVEYHSLLYNCQFAIGNSSSFIKEGAYLGVPAVLIGDRQHNREYGHNVVFAENEKTSINIAIEKAKRFNRLPDRRFGDGRASKRIIQILTRYALR